MSGDSTEPEGLPVAAPGEAQDVPPAGTGQEAVVMERFLRPLGICAMLACIALSMGHLAQRLWPEFPLGLSVALTFLISLESIWANRLLARRGVGREDRTRFRFVEWVVLLLLARLVPYVHLGGARLVVDLNRWASDPASFLGIEFLGLAALLAGFWWAALYLARNLEELEAAPWEGQVSALSDDYYMRSTMPQHGQTNRQAVLERITTAYYAGGALLLIMAGMARLDYSGGFPRRPPSGSGVVLNALVYFVLGLLLISQAQFTIQKARWQIQRVPILDRIGRRWFAMVVVFLVIVALVSALLPMGYSVGLLQALGSAILWVAYVLAQIFYVIVFGLGALVSWLASLMRIEFSLPDAPPEPAAPPIPPEAAAGAGPAWWALVRSILFWGLLGAIALYALVAYARDRWGLLAGFSPGRWLRAFLDLWRGLRGGAREVWRAWAASVRTGLARLLGGKEGALPWWRPRLGRLSPEERIRYYYLSVLHRTERQGFGRPASATPLEYRVRLAQELPGAEAQVEELTQAFVEARYSAHALPEERVRGVGQVWRAVRRALAVRRRGQSDRAEHVEG